MDKPAQYEAPDVKESFDDREIFGDAPAVTAHVPGGSQVTLEG